MTQLQELRKSRGYTQSKVSLDTGIALGTYTTMELGIASISEKNAEILSIYYDTKVNPTKVLSKKEKKISYWEKRIKSLEDENLKLVQEKNELMALGIDCVSKEKYGNLNNEYKELRDKFDDLKARYSLLDDDLYNRNLAYNKLQNELKDLKKNVNTQVSPVVVSNTKDAVIVNYFVSIAKEIEMITSDNVNLSDFMALLSKKMELASIIVKDVE